MVSLLLPALDAALAAEHRNETKRTLLKLAIALADYRDVPALEEALFILMSSYDQLGMTKLRDDTRRVLEKSYPQSPYLTGNGRGPDRPWYRFW